MDYQNYEDYMRSVLGYSPYVQNNYTYTDEQEGVYNYSNDVMPNIQHTEDLNEFYPEIYKMIYPMVCKACNINSNKELTKDLLNQMTDEIYINIEPEQGTREEVPLKNGDVRNPNAKEPKADVKETRQTNFLLRDLIKILLLREWGRPNRPPMRPPYPPQGGRPPMGPGGPGMPPSPRPLVRPRYF